jgi:hypothetical protein
MLSTNGTDELRPVSPLDEYVIIVNPTNRDVAAAERMVIVHQPEDWVTGRFCQNDHTRWPCRLYRWGVNVLLTAGWSEDDVAALVDRAKRGDMPWG